jgi:tetrahydromethanopterin S-methyltransferase subunit B
MSWQDKVVAACGVLFALTLLPTVLDPSAAVPVYTSFPTTVGLAVLAGVFYTMGFRISVVTNLSSSLAWLMIFLLRQP